MEDSHRVHAHAKSLSIFSEQMSQASENVTSSVSQVATDAN